MKVKIGPYKNWVGPQEIADALCFWVKRDPVTGEKPDWVLNFGKWLAEDKHGNYSWLTKICHLVHSKRDREVQIQIDPYDTWNMDNTLAMIILPMLKQLRKTKNSATVVENEDLPPELQATFAEIYDHQLEFDFSDNVQQKRWDMVAARWDWVLGEMIWAFERKYDLRYVLSWEEEHNARVQKGLSLFGKYYSGLWD